MRNTILIVDDMASSRALLRGIFEGEYDLLEAENGMQAMDLLESMRERISAVLLDLVMPEKDGVQVLEEMAQLDMLQEIPVLVISGAFHGVQEEHLLEMGASDIILKPFNPYVIHNKVRNILELYRHKQHLQNMVRDQAEALRRTHDQMVDTLSAIIEYRSLETGQHNLRIRYYTKLLLEELSTNYPEYNLNEDNIRLMASASVLHDIGKIAIPDEILNKPGRLTPEEYEVMKGHSAIGAQLARRLKNIGNNEEYVRYAYNICRHHHERWNGKGYPDGLRGDNIPVCAQAAGLADVYDALVTPRAYKGPVSHERAVNMIINGECGQFSPKLINCFFHLQKQFKDLSRIYADGSSAQAEELDVSLPVPTEELGVTEQLQGKYHALLNYIGATVMDVDLTSGIFHIVYSTEHCFDALRGSTAFSEAVMRLADEAVHPEDRALMIDQLYRKLPEFCESGQRRSSAEYRIYNAASDAYLPYSATVMRLDTGGLAHRRLLVIFQPAMQREEAAAIPAGAEGRMPMDQKVLRRVISGMQVVRYDKGLTMVSGSGILAGILGYTQQEMEAQYGNSLISMMLPEDRETVLRQIREQMEQGSEMEFTFRIPHKDGRPIWMMVKAILTTGEDGAEYFYGTAMEMSGTRMNWERMSRERDRYKLIVEQSDDVIFEYDVASDSIVYSNNWERILGKQPDGTGFLKRIARSSRLHPEDLEKVLKLARQMMDGTGGHGELEVRIAQSTGAYMWCRLRVTAQYDNSGKAECLIGTISNINEMKQVLRSYQLMAERDGLTGLINKETFMRMVQEHLRALGQAEEREESCGRGALLIIDLDNFKLVNDKFGHLYGDTVLTQFANQIKTLFRQEDLVARIGGDEFAVFMWGAVNRELVQYRCDRAIHEIVSGMSREVAECGLTCSIGVSFAPDHGSAYQELFQGADKALYLAKNNGKNRCEFYDPGAISLAPQDAPDNISHIDSDENPSMTTKGFVEHFFHSMYLSTDLENTIDATLALLGQQMDVSRVYIFENSDDGLYMNNTFEWCNKGISAEKDTLQNVPYSTIPSGWENNYNENGVFYCTDITELPPDQRAYLEPQGIKSMLQCSIRDKGVYRGFIGFDDCLRNRLWTKYEITLLSSMSEMLSVFLLKKRAQDKAVRREKDLMRALDNQSAWIYIIDPETCELRFANARTRELLPQFTPGMVCHKSIMNREERCPGCPALNIADKVSASAVMENESLDLKVLVEASAMSWGGEPACMVSCRDVKTLQGLK